MRITILLLIVGLCIVSAKYLPYEHESSVLLRNRRSNSEESNPSAESNNDSNNKDDDDDDEDDNSEEQDFNKERRKEVEQQRKLEEKLAKEQRKQEEKREKEERKHLERIEKEKRKEEEKHKKLLEKAEKEEKKRQEKQRKQLENLQKEALAPTSNEDSFLETEEENSVELGNIWRNHIYIKYGLTLASTNAEKKAALDKYLKEELGLNSNSTQSERQQAIIKLIETKLQNDTAFKEAIRSQLLNQINTVTINKLRNKLDHNIEKLKNKTNAVNNITLPWASIIQKNLEERKSFLQSISQFLSNVLPNWAPKTQNPNLNATLEQNAQGNNNDILYSGSGVNNKSAFNEVSANKNIVSIQPSESSPTGSSNVINSNINNVIAENNVTPTSPVSDTKLNINDVHQVGPANKDIIDTTTVPESNHNSILSNVEKVSKSSVKPSTNIDSSVPRVQLSDNKDVSRISSVSLNSEQTLAIGVIANDVSVTKDISADSDHNKSSTNDNIQPSLSESLSNNVQASENGIVANQENIRSKINGKSEVTSIPDVSPVSPSISISNGQLSDTENLFGISVNDSNMSSINSSSDSNMIKKSGGDIVEPRFSSVPLNSVPASESGAAANEVSLTKDISSDPANKVISTNDIIPPSLSESLPKNVQATENGIVANQENLSSKINGKSKASSIPNASSVTPSKIIDSSISNAQLSENVSKISVNDSNIPSVNSSSDSNIIKKSAGDIVEPRFSSVPLNSEQASASGAAANEVSLTKNISSHPADKKISTNDIIQPSLSESLPKNVQASENGIVANQENLSSKINGKSEASSIPNASSVTPSIVIDSSISNAQLSENVSKISVNDSNIPSVNSSSDSNIIEKSAGDIVEPRFSSVPLNSEQASASGAAANEVSLTKNISSDPADKKMSTNHNIQSSLSESSSNNVQVSENAIVGNQDNISSKTNGKSAVNASSNVSDSLNNKVNSSLNVEINNGVDMISVIKPAEIPVVSLLSNKSSIDVGVASVNSIASKIESSDNTIRINSNDSNIDSTNGVNTVSQISNLVSSKLENATNDIIVNENVSNTSGLKVNIESSVNYGAMNVSSTTDKSAHQSESSDVATIPENDISTSPSNVEPIYDNIGTTVNVIDIATNSPVYNNLPSSPAISESTVSSNNKSKKNVSINEVQSSNLSGNSSFLGVRNESLEGNYTSATDLANVGVTNEINISDPVLPLTTNNDSRIIKTIDVITADSATGKEILPKPNESNANTIVSSVPVLIADSITVTLNPEVSTVVTASAASSSSTISEKVKNPDNSSAAIGSKNVVLSESNKTNSIQKVANESALNVGNASTEPTFSGSTFIPEEPSTLSDNVNNVNTASSNLGTESSLFDIVSSIQTDVSQSDSTTLPADSSTLAQVDGVTLPTETGASVVEILPQV